MSKYKLINNKTKEEHLCNKVTIDGFDYYVSNEQAIEGFYGYIDFQGGDIKKVGKHFADDWKKVIATNNPNIDIPKVVDDVEVLYPTNRKGDMWMPNRDEINNQYRQEGYSKSQETHPNSDEDMKSFGKFCIENNFCKEENRYYQYWEMLKLWKEQQPKKVYYNG